MKAAKKAKITSLQLNYMNGLSRIVVVTGKK